MIGSPNHVFFIYDGDDSDAVGAPAGPAGSAEIEKTFEAFFNMSGVPFKGTDFYRPLGLRSLHCGVVSPPAVSSPALKASRPPLKLLLWGGTAGSLTTRAITRPAIPMPTTTTSPWMSTRTRLLFAYPAIRHEHRRYQRRERQRQLPVVPGEFDRAHPPRVPGNSRLIR